MQVKKTVAALLMIYDMKFYPANAKLDEDFSIAASALKPVLLTVKSRP